MNSTITLIPCVEHFELPEDAQERCQNHDRSPICKSAEIYYVDLDGNPLQKFLEDNGYKFSTDRDWTYIGIFGS